MATEYYLIINEAQKGPFAFEELTVQGLRPDMLVWRAGLPDWTKASELPELFELMGMARASEPGRGNQYGQQQPNYGQQQYGPNNQYGQKPNFSQNPQYGSQPNEGQNRQYGQQQPNYGQNPQYGQQPNYSQNPQYGQQPNYGQNPQYGQQSNYGRNPQYSQDPNYGQNPQYGQQPNYGQNPNNFQPVRQNWLTWAIVATVIGFLFSCIGGIFGVIGIVQANKANNYYKAGYDQMGDQANSTAKWMTIVGLVLGGIGILANGYFFSNGGFLSYI
ncbi:MAG: GYF domain-containing protein [Muribaculaceae bacterium]|nr:GYF domain-containing protein [Muribaculaceae bacterium]